MQAPEVSGRCDRPEGSRVRGGSIPDDMAHGDILGISFIYWLVVWNMLFFFRSSNHQPVYVCICGSHATVAIWWVERGKTTFLSANGKDG